MAVLHHIISPSFLLAALATLSPAAARVLSRGVTPAPPRNLLASRQTTAFVNFYSAAGCADDSFIVALATNSGPIAGPDNCVEHNSLDHFSEQQQDDGSFKVFMKPNPEAVFGGSGYAILRSPVEAVDEDFCGIAQQRMSDTNNCYDANLGNDYMLQTCLKDQNCVPEALRRRAPDPACFKDQNKRTFAQTSETMVASSGVSCSGPESCQVQVQFTAEHSSSISASASAGIEGVFSVTFGFEFTSSNSKSASTTFSVAPGSQGNIVWTPIYTCITGRTESCEGAQDQGDVELCSVETLASEQPNGQYSFLELGKRWEDHLETLRV